MSSLPYVLFVAGPAPLGGSNRSLVTLLDGLEGQVHRVLAAPGDGAFVTVVRERGLAEDHVSLPRFRGPQEGVPAWRRRGMQVVAALRVAGFALRHRRRLAAIHANATTGLNLALPAAVLTRIPVTVWVHDPVGSEWGRRLGPWWRRALPDVHWAAVSGTAAEVAVSNGLCRSEDVEVVPNPIDPRDVLGDRPAPTGEIAVGYLGAPTERKGFDLLPSMAEAVADLPVRWLLFTNRNPSEFNAAVWERLDGLSSVVTRPPDPDVRRVYTQCDLVVVPSREESFSRITAEAMLNGIPVVASDLPPLRSLLGTGAGAVFPVGDSAAAAIELRRFVLDARARRVSGEEGRRRAREFRTEGVAHQMLDLYGIARRR